MQLWTYGIINRVLPTRDIWCVYVSAFRSRYTITLFKHEIDFYTYICLQTTQVSANVYTYSVLNRKLLSNHLFRKITKMHTLSLLGKNQLKMNHLRMWHVDNKCYLTNKTWLWCQYTLPKRKLYTFIMGFTMHERLTNDL